MLFAVCACLSGRVHLILRCCTLVEVFMNIPTKPVLIARNYNARILLCVELPCCWLNTEFNIYLDAVLDLVFSINLNLVSRIVVVPRMNDHLAVLTTLHVRPKQHSNKHSHTVYMHNSANFEGLTQRYF